MVYSLYYREFDTKIYFFCNSETNGYYTINVEISISRFLKVKLAVVLVEMKDILKHLYQGHSRGGGRKFDLTGIN